MKPDWKDAPEWAQYIDALEDVVSSVTSEGFHILPDYDECLCSQCELVRKAYETLEKRPS